MIYQFKNTKTGAIKDIVMKMSEYTHYKGENGTEDFWERIYDVPQVNMGNTRTDPYDANAFVRKTGAMKGTYGEMLNYSEELSNERAAKSDTGEDPLKRKHFQEYEKKTKGKKHPKDFKKVIEKNGVKVEL